MPLSSSNPVNHVDDADAVASQIAAAIGVPARARMLYALADGRARTSTELAMIAEIAPSTASVHLQRLKHRQLVTMFAQGKHRYYSLDSAEVAAALEALSVLAGSRRTLIVTRTPDHLRFGRTCYDHIAGALGVSLHDRFRAHGWLSGPPPGDTTYELTAEGAAAFAAIGVDVEAARRSRRRFAFACVDWSERRPHLAGAMGAALLSALLQKQWIRRELEGRAITVTALGEREMARRFGLQIGDPIAAR